MADDIPDLVPLGTGSESKARPAADGPAKPPVPVTLITGFLGAGKTTLIRHVLSAPHGLKIAVILNEFGEGVEEAYFQDLQGLRDSSGEWIELNNGCMCCATKSDFVQALEGLLAKDTRPDYILIETTGMANPGPVASALWTDEQLEAGVQLDSIVTVVDAINIDRQLHAKRADDTVNEAQVQVAYADLILLNKMDLCTDEAIERAEADIRAINSTVHIMRTTQSNIDLNMLLNRQGYKLGGEMILEPIAEGDGDDGENGENDGDSDAVADAAAEADVRFPGGVVPDLTVIGTRISTTAASVASSEGGGGGGGSVTPLLGRTSGGSLGRPSVGGHSRGVSLSLDPLGSDNPQHARHGKPHDPQVQTITLSTDEPLELEKVKGFLDKLLWDRETLNEDIYRVKGVLNIKGKDEKHMLQAVYELYNIAPSALWLPHETRRSRIVVIGRALNKPLVQRLFDKLTVPPAAQ